MYQAAAGDRSQRFLNVRTSTSSNTLYIFNLSYNIKAHDFFQFIQEKVLSIPSDKNTKCKSPVGLVHMDGISRLYNAMQKETELQTD